MLHKLILFETSKASVEDKFASFTSSFFSYSLAIKTLIHLSALQSLSSLVAPTVVLIDSPLHSLIASSSSVVVAVLLLVDADESFDELLIGSEDGLWLFWMNGKSRGCSICGV